MRIRVKGQQESHIIYNVHQWFPADPVAFDNARKATVWSRIGTHFSPDRLKAIMDGIPDIQTFMLSINTVVLVFSRTDEEHKVNLKAAKRVLSAFDMRQNFFDSILSADDCTGAGIRLDQIGDRKAYTITNEGVPLKGSALDLLSQRYDLHLSEEVQEMIKDVMEQADHWLTGSHVCHQGNI